MKLHYIQDIFIELIEVCIRAHELFINYISRKIMFTNADHTAKRNNFMFYWGTQKLPQIRTVILRICIGKVV